MNRISRDHRWKPIVTHQICFLNNPLLSFCVSLGNILCPLPPGPKLTVGDAGKKIAPQKVDLEARPKIQGADIYEFQLDNLDSKPWLEPGLTLASGLNSVQVEEYIVGSNRESQ